MSFSIYFLSRLLIYLKWWHSLLIFLMYCILRYVHTVQKWEPIVHCALMNVSFHNLICFTQNKIYVRTYNCMSHCSSNYFFWFEQERKRQYLLYNPLNFALLKQKSINNIPLAQVGRRIESKRQNIIFQHHNVCEIENK